MQQRAIVTVFTVVAVLGAAQAAEPRLTGNMQVQGSFEAPEGGGESRWSMETPESWLGVEVSERLQGSQYLGVWQFDLDPLGEEDVNGQTRQMYLEWRAPLYQFRGGRLDTLERKHLVRPIAVMNGLGVEGTFTGQVVQATVDRAIQVDASSAEVAFVSAEWQISDPDTGSDTVEQWATAAGLNTPEGDIVVLYRDDGVSDDGLWGLSVVWEAAPWTLGGSYLYRSEPLSWDLVTSYRANTVVTKLGYGRDQKTEDSYWALGVDQHFSQSVLYYSELRWQPTDDRWLLQSGFRLRF